jgi:hypothetical protein
MSTFGKDGGKWTYFQKVRILQGFCYSLNDDIRYFGHFQGTGQVKPGTSACINSDQP